MTKPLRAGLATVSLVLAFVLLLASGISAVLGLAIHDETWFSVTFGMWLASGLTGALAALLVHDESSTPSVKRPVIAWGYLYLASAFAGLLVPSVFGVCQSGRRMRTQNSLKQIGLAFHNYADKQGDGRFPPAAIPDSNGQPLLSWRVLLLPYLGEEALSKQFRLDEPWDSPHHIKLLPHMPAIYQPTYPDTTAPGTTRYQVFVGPGTPFEIIEGPRFPRDFPDRPHETLLVCEAHEPLPWTKPADLNYHPDRPLPSLGWRGVPQRKGLGMRSSEWFSACCADGSVRTLHFAPERSERIARQVIVRNDGKGWEDE